ncbi:MAG: hypothetical protein Phog2KO_10660 [Phototrophicaceae bacterium]
MSDGKVYEMLWDCQFCGAKGNLGLTHRFCANCGAPQNPDSRYYPSDEEKVAVHDHKFVGVDVTCPACNELNSAEAEFCGQCGSPLTEGARARTLSAETAGVGQEFQSSGSRDIVKEKFDAQMLSATGQSDDKKKRGTSKKTIFMVLGIVALIISGIVGALNINKDVTVIVTDHEWERSISIQEYDDFTASSWQDSRPAGDNVTMIAGSCQRQQRSTRRVADGETCRSVRTDNGDGTFSQRQQCTTNYRDEPVYDQMCRWEGFRWEDSRTETTSGDLDDKPYWEDIDLDCEGQSRVGCEREDGRSESYEVLYDNTEDDSSYRCSFPQEQWEDIPVESLWNGQARAVGNTLLCDTLERQ